MSTALYRAFAADDSLLYVGISDRPMARFRQHGADKAWWVEVARVAVEHFDTRAEADAAEAKAIQTESPRYNVAKSATDAAERAARAEAKRKAREDAERAEAEWRARSYDCSGRVRCMNCGLKPKRLEKGWRIIEIACPDCKLATLKVVAA